MSEFENETASWLNHQLAETDPIELELGSLIAAASLWTEDETDLSDLVGGLIETGRIELAVG